MVAAHQHVHEKGAHECATCLVALEAPLRCGGCNRMLAELVTAEWRIKCPRCGVYSQSGDKV